MNNIESKVLEMKFDNEQFESAVATTMSTLDKFKEKLKFDDAGKNIHKLGQATNNYQYSLQDVGTSLSNLERYFAACGTVGSKIFDTLTSKAANFVTNGIGNFVSGITQGGLSRAMNLEQAKFQMQGIYKDAEKVHDIIYDAILPELMGTPYSLDQAAVVIGQLGASGIQSAEQVKQATRAIAGLAAMSGRGFDEVGRVFSKVAGQGNMMGGELQQLSTYGINAAANLAEYFQKVYKGQVEATNAVKKHVAEVAKDFGLNEAAIRDAASKRKIYYEDMASAMDYLYGEHAKKSTEMYTGALEDLKAALARIGAEPAAVGLNVLRDAFNALVPAVDAVNAVLKPFTNATKDVVKSADGEKIFGGQMYGSLARQVQKLGIQFANLFVQMDENGKITRWTEKSIKKYKKSLKELAKSGQEVLDWQKAYAKYASSGDAVMNPHMWRTITALTKSFVNIFKALGKIIGAVGKGVKKAFPKVTLENIANLAEHIEKFTKALTPGAANLLRFQNLVQAVFTPFGLLFRGVINLAKLVVKAFLKVYDAAKPVINSFMQIVNAISTFIIKMGVSITHLFKAIANMAKFASEIAGSISKLLKLDKILGFVQKGFQKIADLISKFTTSASSGIEKVTKKIEELTSKAKFSEFSEKIKTATDRFSDFINAAFHLDEITAGFKEFWEPIKEFLDSNDLFETIANSFKNLVDWFGKLIGKDDLANRVSTSLDNLQTSIGGFTSKPVGKIRKWLGDLGTSIAEFLSNMDQAGYVSDWLRNNFKPLEFLHKIGLPIKQVIDPLGQSIIDFAKSFTGIESSAELINKAGEMLKSAFDKIVSAIGILFDNRITDKFKTINETLFDKSLSENAKTIGSNFKTAITPFTDAIKTLSETIKEYFSDVDPQTIKKILVSLVLLLVALSYMATLSNARKTIKGFLIILDRFAAIPVAMLKTIEAFEDVAIAFKAIAKAIKSVAMILAIASSLVIFAAALKILSTIDTHSLINSTIVLGIAIAAIIGLFHYLDKLDLDAFGNKVFKLSMAILGVGGSMLLMALAIKMIAETIGSAGAENVAGAVGAIGALIIAIGILASILSNKNISNDVKTLGWAAVGLGQGMKMMAEACKIMSQEMEPDELDRAIGAISQLMIMFAVFAAANWHGNATGKAAFAMIGVALSLALVARTLKYIGKNLEKADLEKATHIISEITVFFSLFALAMGGAAKLGASSMMATGMVLSMALFIKVLAESMMLMATLVEGGELDKISEVIQAFLAMMAVISLISAVGGKGAAAGPLALAALASSLMLLASAIYMLSQLTWGQVINGFYKLGLSLAAAIGAMIAFSWALKTFNQIVSPKDALGILAVAAAMTLFTACIYAMAGLPFDSLLVSLAGLVAILISTGLVISAFSTIGPGLLLVGAAFALVGAAALFVGAGLALVTLALSALIPIIIAIGKVSQDDLTAGLEILKITAEGLKEVFYRIADGVLYFGAAIAASGFGLLVFAIGIAAVAVAVIVASVAILALAGSFAVLASVLDAFVPQVKDSVLGTLGTLISKVGEFFGSLRLEKDKLEKDLEESKETTTAAAEESTKSATEVYKEGRSDVLAGAMGLFDQSEVTEVAGKSGKENATSFLDNFSGTLTGEGPGIMDDAFSGMITENSFGSMESLVGAEGFEIPSIFGKSVEANARDAAAGVEVMANKASEGASNADDSFVKAAGQSAKKWANALKDSTEPKNKAKSMAKSAASVTDDSDIGWSDAGKNAAKGFASGMSAGTPIWVTAAARDMAKAAVAAAKAELNEHSPSRVFMEIGRFVGEGFAIGINSMASNVEKTTSDLMDTSIGAARIAAAAINAATDIDEFTPTITPVVDLSNVDQSVNQMGSMFNSAFGVTTPFGAMNAAFAAQSFADSRNQNARMDSINKLASKIDAMTETMNSRSLNNYITVDGASDPEMFADDLIRSFRLNARTV